MNEWKLPSGSTITFGDGYETNEGLNINMLLNDEEVIEDMPDESTDTVDTEPSDNNTDGSDNSSQDDPIDETVGDESVDTESEGSD